MKVIDIEDERSEFKAILLKNPNFFGTFPEFKAEPVKKMKYNTKYEEIKCVGYKPEEDLLYAIINVKLPYGYKGNLCSKGSFEYVRFFVDWNGDGDYKDADEDVGIASVNVHDIPDEGVCLEKYKPLSYAVKIKLNPRKKVCSIPYLVKVKAILSWEIPPTSGDPDYPSVWGNMLESWIQIEPKKLILADIIKAVDLKEIKVDKKIIDLDVPISKKYSYTPLELKRIYEDKGVPEHRFDLAKVHQIIVSLKKNPTIKIDYQGLPGYEWLFETEWSLLEEGEYNTTYEELNCLGLEYDRDTLVGTLSVKRPYGYSGNLCSDGSYEHVAFWAYVRDEIEQMCIWKYLGTSKVNVHDIEKLPEGVLTYAVRMPVDLSIYKDKCSKPKILKIRAVLSWKVPPSTDDPFQVPIWGNSIEALVQLKPLSMPGIQKPYIWSVGNMAVESISGNPYTLISSSIGDGYANGLSVEGWNANESPFGGRIQITGTITGAPDDPLEANKLLYKIQWRKVGKPAWHDIDDEFRIWIRINDVPSGYIDQVATGGYFKFQKDLTPPHVVEVEDNVLGNWLTPVSEGDGLYELRVLLKKLGAPAVGDVPADHVSSEKIRVRIDNTIPSADVSLDAGPCTLHKVGDTITGKFTATDTHFRRFRLIVEPNIAGKPTLSPTSGSYPTFLGGTDQPFSLTTTSSTTPCGYVVRLDVWDRTIRYNHLGGNHNKATVGLCLLVETPKKT